VRALARRGELCRFAKGAVLIQEGSHGDTLYIVLEGRLRVYGSHVANEREITHGTYGPGEYVGEMSLDGGPRSASVAALEPTVCSMVTRRTLEAHLAEHPSFAFELLAKVIRRARMATISAKGMALNDVYGRLKALLEGLAEPQPDGTRRIAEKLRAWRGVEHRQHARQLGLDVLDARRPGRVGGQELRRRAAGGRGHLLPQRDAGARVVAGARGQLQAERVGLGLVLAAELQRQQLAADAGQPRRPLPRPSSADSSAAPPRGDRRSCPCARAHAPQRVRGLVAHDHRHLVVTAAAPARMP
jgi:CRP/FNR family cyclic AMP-dependent transcriptional regulator